MKRLFFFLTCLLLGLLPWHAFLKTWLASVFLGSNADYLPVSSNILSLWKEILLLILFIGLAWSVRKVLQDIIKEHWFTLLSIYLISLLLFGTLFVANFPAFILGLRTDALFALALLVGFLGGNYFGKEKIAHFLKITLWSLLTSFVLFLTIWFVFPNMGIWFGYSPYQSSYVDDKPLPVYHCLFVGEHCIPRLQASFSGPNQTGSLAILLGGILVILGLPWWLLVIPALGLILTFSRSAFIGAALGSLFSIPKKWLLWSGSTLLFILSSMFVVYPDVITHGLSSSEHWHKTVAGLQRISEQPLGSGLGSAGPVSRRLLGEANALISENWYLQIGEEAGIMAFILLLTFTIYIVLLLLRSKTHLSRIMGAVLLATSVQALFLHLWEDSVVTILIWFWVGIALCYNINDHSKDYAKH
ncbi:MAG: hypothetical protein HY817_01100 [Candidatus Abawacabacteria bacterium]|nr:hypothetical protein [Candidatus Abawacabacteria bacterium]